MMILVHVNVVVVDKKKSDTLFVKNNSKITCDIKSCYSIFIVVDCLLLSYTFYKM